jgi:hypothetical protein
VHLTPFLLHRSFLSNSTRSSSSTFTAYQQIKYLQGIEVQMARAGGKGETVSSEWKGVRKKRTERPLLSLSSRGEEFLGYRAASTLGFAVDMAVVFFIFCLYRNGNVLPSRLARFGAGKEQEGFGSRSPIIPLNTLRYPCQQLRDRHLSFHGLTEMSFPLRPG